MTRLQRKIHRRAWLALIIALPIALALAAVLRAQHARLLIAHSRHGGTP